MMKVILSVFFCGEKPLGVTYWLCYVVPVLIITAFSYTLQDYRFALLEMQTLAAFLMFVRLLLLLIVTYVCGIAVIRSAWHKRTPGFWGWVASTIAAFHMFRVPLELSGFTFDNFSLERAASWFAVYIN